MITTSRPSRIESPGRRKAEAGRAAGDESGNAVGIHQVAPSLVLGRLAAPRAQRISSRIVALARPPPSHMVCRP